MLLEEETFDKFKYRSCELGSTSKRPVVVKCDYCNNIVEKKYCKYKSGRTIVEKDSCSNQECINTKTKESMVKKYDVESAGALIIPRKFCVRTNSSTGTTSEYKPWTEEDIQYLRDSCGTQTCAEIGKYLDRTTKSVQHTFAALGLSRDIAKIGDVINGWHIDDIYMMDIGRQKISMAKITSVVDGPNIEKEERLTRLTNKQIPWPDNRRTDNVLRNTQHGESKDRLYRIWASMKGRCTNSKQTQWTDYGGRGITICDDWMEYLNFREWSLNNGYDESLTLDRIDVNGNYEPNNCRWADEATQMSNKRNSKILTITAFGETKNVYEWTRDDRCFAGTVACLHYRITAGWEPERALTQASERRRKPKISEWLELSYPEIYKEWEQL